MPCCRASVFIKRWQSTSNCDENISDTFLFLPHFDVICNLGRNLFLDHMINWIMHAFDWFLLVIHWRTDAQMTSLWLTFCLFYYIEQIDYMLSRVFTVIDHKRPQNVIRTSVKHSAVYYLMLFWSEHSLKSVWSHLWSIFEQTQGHIGSNC